MDASGMKTPNIRFPSPEANDDFMVIKTMPASFVIYKDNRVLRDKKLSHYLFSQWVDFDRKKEHIDAIK